MMTKVLARIANKMQEFTYLKKVEMPVSRLKIGMYVAKLDKAWENSPFLFQGFPIEEQKQLDLLREECSTVIIEFKSQESYDNYLSSDILDEEVNPGADEGDLALLDELPNAIKLFKSTVKLMKLTLRLVMQAKSFNIGEIETAVVDFITSLEHNKEALLLASNVRSEIAYDAEHCVRITILAIAFGQHLGRSQEQLRVLGLGGLLHDIGKSLIPAKILNKEGKLLREDALLLREHPRKSFDILSKIEGISEAVKEIALSHHERHDGKGYPRHISKDRVSGYAKIISIISVYDAIVSARNYRTARAPSVAFKILNDGRAEKFDPELVDSFLQWMGVSPTGALVEMTSGEIGIVIKNNEKRKLSPRVLLVTDENKKNGYQKMIDVLTMEQNSNGEPYKVKSVLTEFTHGIHIEHYLDRESFGMPVWLENKETESNKDSPFSKYL